MFDPAVFLVFFFGYCLAIFAFLKVVFSYFIPSDASQNLVWSLGQLVTWLVLWVPVQLSNTLTNIYNNLRTNYPYYILAIALIFVSYGVNKNQPEFDKLVDGIENDLYFPFMNNIVLPVFNFGRIIFDGVICFSNVLGNIGRIIRNQFFDITFSCSSMDWESIPENIGKFAIQSINSTSSWMLSGFKDDFKIAPMLDHLADAYSALNPLFDCQCNDLNFLWPILIHPTYGIIQSKHLHLFPEAVFNSVFSAVRLFFDAGLGIAEAAFVGCSGNATAVRECQVQRGPKFDDISRLSCNILTHSGDFLDDILYSIDAMIADKLGLIVPWNSTPRPFAMFAMPLCVATDLGWIQLDAITHLDLFFTLPASSYDGNYAAEINLEGVMARLYNITDQLNQIGQDIGGDFAENIFCIVSKAIRIIFAVVDFILQVFRRLLAKNFELEAIRELMSFPAISNIITDLEDTSEDLVTCANATDDELGPATKYFVIGVAKLISPLVNVVKGIIENSQSGDVISYLGSTDFSDNFVDVYEGLLIIAGSAGASIRQLGGFGSTTCTVRDVADTPQNLISIEMESMDLNIMCSLGTFVEMTLRYPMALFKQVFDIVYAVAQLVVSLTGNVDFDDFTAPFADGAALDIGKQNGIIETQCLWLDSIALFIPSLFTLGNNPITCPAAPGLVATRIYNILRAAARSLLLTPFFVIRGVLQTFGIFFCAGGSCINFGTFCDSFLIPVWKVSVIPVLQLFISIVDLVSCLAPISFLDDLSFVLGRAFISTSYGSNVIVPCSDISDDVDGGDIADFFCDFFEAIGAVIQIVIMIFEKGFFPALWELIITPLLEIFDEIISIIECAFDNVRALFDKLGSCGSALIRFDLGDIPDWLDDIEDSCGNWDDVFKKCLFGVKVPEFGINTPIPGGGSGGTAGSGNTGTLVPPKKEMWGVCILSDGTCVSRPSADSDYNGEQCANAISTGANRLIIGQTCDEVNLTATLSPTGACCVPNKECRVMTYDQCNATANLNGENHVWSENESCSALNAECRVINSPYTTQLGCCITDGGKSPFNFDLRHAIPDMNAYDCYLIAESVRAYYIPGDTSCTDVQDLSFYNDIINATDPILDGVATSPFFASGEVSQTCCTPEDNIYKSVQSSFIQTGCRVFNGVDSVLPDIPDDFFPDIQTVFKIAGTGFDNSTGKYWRCRSIDEWVHGNDGNITELACEVDNLCTLQEQRTCEPGCLVDPLDTPPVLFNYEGSVAPPFTNTPFADPSIMVATHPADRQLLFNTHFWTDCRPVFARIDAGGFVNDIYYHYGEWEYQGFAEASFFIGNNRQLCAIGTDTDIDGNTCMGTDCRFRRRGSDIPRFDQCFPYNIGVGLTGFLADLDTLSETTKRPNAKVMKILYLTNSTYDLGRDNTDARCNTFIPVEYPAPPPMAPDVYEEEVPVFQERRLLSMPTKDLENTSHPCHLIYDIMMDDNSSRAINYLMRMHLKSCQFSNGLAHTIDAALLWNSHIKGKRLCHPHTFYDSVIGWSTFFNLTRGISMALSYVGYVFTEYTFANNTNTNMTNMTSGVDTWHEYAYVNGVHDDLSIRIGEFITLLAKIVVAHDHQGRTIPNGLGIFSMFLRGAKYVSTKHTNYADMYPDRYNSSTVNPPIFSEYGWQWITDLFTFNWSNVTNDYSLALQKREKVYNMKAFLTSVNPVLNQTTTLEASLNGDVCDPRDRSCLDCEIMVGSAETIVEVILNCIEDLGNSKRFNLNISKVDLERNNTFLQANDTLKCLNPEPITNENFILTAILEFVNLFGVDSRYWLARTKCYLTNFNDEDPHSIMLYTKKAVTCDPVYDVSAHRGRSGAGLKTAFIWVSVGIIVVFALSVLCLPIIPTFWISLLVWFLMILFVAYWWSPMCFFPMPPFPIPVLPDALMDDIYTEIREMIPVNCTSYHPDITSPNCQTLGRTFVDCSKYGFDYAGGRHLAYMLYSIDPSLPQSIRDTSLPGLSSVMESPYYSNAFDDIGSIHGTPIGEYCFGANDLRIARTIPLLTAIVQFFLLSTLAFSFLGLAVVALATVALVSAVIVDASAYVISFVTRQDINWRRYRYEPR